MPSPRFLYLHGLASSPQSKKAVALAEHYAARGVEVERLDMRQPSMERLRISAMVDHVRERIGGERDRAVLFGSSLGALAACRVSERDPRVCALVLMAPAFGMARGSRMRLGEAGWENWRATGWLEMPDYATGKKTRLEFGFMDEMERMEAADGGMPDVRVPVLIVHGVKDETVPVRQSREFARGKRHVRLVEMDDGHELVESLPRISEEADGFLRGFLG